MISLLDSRIFLLLGEISKPPMMCRLREGYTPKPPKGGLPALCPGIFAACHNPNDTLTLAMPSSVYVQLTFWNYFHVDQKTASFAKNVETRIV
jgi:hypothetical protein